MKVIIIILGAVLLIPAIGVDTLLLVSWLICLFSGEGGSGEPILYGLTRGVLRMMGVLKPKEAPKVEEVKPVLIDTPSQRTSVAGWIVRIVVWTAVAAIVGAAVFVLSM